MMVVPFLDLRQQNVMCQARLKWALDTLVSDNKLILGPAVKQFEQLWAGYNDKNFCIGVGNGYDALRLMLLASGVTAGTYVLVSANTHVSDWYAIMSVGANPVPVEPNLTYNMDPDCALEAVQELEYEHKRISAILVTHLYGAKADMIRLRTVADYLSCPLLVDACQAHGLKAENDTYGDAAAFSFYPTKNLGALGDGGAVVTDDPGAARYMRALRNYGGEEKDTHVYLNGANSRLDELQAAFLMVKLDHLNRWNARRKEIAQRYTTAFQNLPITLPPIQEENVHHQYVIQSDNRDTLRKQLLDRGIGTMIHYPTPPHRQKAFLNRSRSSWKLPITDLLTSRIVSLPMNAELTDDQVEYVIKSVRECV